MCEKAVPLSERTADLSSQDSSNQDGAAQASHAVRSTCLVALAGSGGGFLQDVQAAGRAESDDVGEADFCPVDLPRAGLAAQGVAHFPDIGDAGGRDQVPLGFESSAYVHWHIAVAPRGTPRKVIGRISFFAKHQI